MTTIAYRDGIIACDSQLTDGCGTKCNRVIKIRHLSDGSLYGVAGKVDDRELLGLLENRKGDWPSVSQLSEIKEIIALVITPDERIWLVETGESDPCVIEMNMPFAAIGSGYQVAIGAMATGSTALEAVKIAADWDEKTSGPFYSLTFECDN